MKAKTGDDLQFGTENSKGGRESRFYCLIYNKQLLITYLIHP